MNQSGLMLLLLIGLLWQLPALAAPANLQIRPHTCVVDADGLCQAALQLHFESAEPRAVCFLVRQQQLRFCQPGGTVHELAVQLAVSERTRIDVVDAHDEKLLSFGWLELASYEPNTTRKRRRFSWSFDQ